MVPIDYFGTAASLWRQRVAIIGGATSVTFAALEAITHRVAKIIADASDDGPPVPDAIYAPQRLSCAVAVALSVMRAIVPVYADNPVDVTQRFLVGVAPKIAFFTHVCAIGLPS